MFDLDFLAERVQQGRAEGPLEPEVPAEQNSAQPRLPMLFLLIDCILTRITPKINAIRLIIIHILDQFPLKNCFVLKITIFLILENMFLRPLHFFWPKFNVFLG